MPAALDLVGRKFGKLTVTGKAKTASSRVHWVCDCECGGRHQGARTDHLLSGGTWHCGCSWGDR